MVFPRHTGVISHMPSAGVAAMKRWVALRTVRVGVGKGGEWVEEILHKFIGGLPHYL